MPLDEWKLPDESPWVPRSLHPSPRAIVSPENAPFEHGRVLENAPVQGCKTLIYARRVSDTRAVAEDAPLKHGCVLEDARSGCYFLLEKVRYEHVRQSTIEMVPS